MGNIIAVTGATGKKSGGAFAKLLSENIETINKMFPGGIRTLVRETSDTSDLEKILPSAEIRKGDLKDQDYLDKAFDGVDTVVHIAGIHSTPTLIEAAARCGVRRVILVHTTGIYSKYKAAGEEYRKIDEKVSGICKENDIVLTICRPTMIYGNITDNNVVVFIKMVDKLPVMPVVNGARYSLQPVHYEDLAKAYFSILTDEETTGNKDYILSGGEPIELRRMLSVIGENLGKRVKFISCPFFIAYAGAWFIYCCTFGKIDFREKVQRLCEPRTYSFEDAKKDFGYAPRVFEEGIPGEIEEYKRMKKA
ncbi:MAG: NmrA family NAD(P)-binding protein [Oscillospiraceae bacterium]|nr:NmrA family NAD(P)-binding protein [Oscillospiraceae bacterium]